MNNGTGASVRIAGLTFELYGRLPMLDEFVCHSKKKSDGQICCMSERLYNGSERVVSEHNDVTVSIRNDGSWLFASPRCRDSVQVSLSADYRKICLYIADTESIVLEQVLRSLLRMAIESAMVFNSRVSLHAACVSAGDEAVAFTGVSGMGKSTRASAWVEANGAEFISGDRPTLGIGSDGVMAYGVPWDGKEQVYRNTELPLKAILDVRRSGNTDYLRRLTPDQAQAVIIKQVFIPMWDAVAAPYAIMNARKLSKSVPVYRVFCGPDEESAKNIYDILVNNPQKILEAAEEMKIKEGFVLRKVADEYIVMPTGSNIAKFDGAIALNEVSAFIFEQLKNPVSKDDLVKALLAEYDVDAEVAERDVDALVAKFDSMGIIE